MIGLVVGLPPRRAPYGVGGIFPLTRCKDRAKTRAVGGLSRFLFKSERPPTPCSKAIIPLPLIEAKRFVENNDRRGVGNCGLPTVSIIVNPIEWSSIPLINVEILR